MAKVRPWDVFMDVNGDVICHPFLVVFFWKIFRSHPIETSQFFLSGWPSGSKNDVCRR